jgi:hypothetical protein
MRRGDRLLLLAHNRVRHPWHVRLLECRSALHGNLRLLLE